MLPKALVGDFVYIMLHAFLGLLRRFFGLGQIVIPYLRVLNMSIRDLNKPHRKRSHDEGL